MRRPTRRGDIPHVESFPIRLGRPALQRGAAVFVKLGAALGGELLDVATTEDENARPDGQDALGLEIAAGDHAGDEADGVTSSTSQTSRVSISL